LPEDDEGDKEAPVLAVLARSDEPDDVLENEEDW
jgi:hypothetical protein